MVTCLISPSSSRIILAYEKIKYSSFNRFNQFLALFWHKDAMLTVQIFPSWLYYLYNVNFYTWKDSLHIETNPEFTNQSTDGLGIKRIRYRSRFNIKMLSYQYKNSHYKDKMVSQSSHLYIWWDPGKIALFRLNQPQKFQIFKPTSDPWLFHKESQLFRKDSQRIFS